MSNDQVNPDETTEILRLATTCLDLPGDYVEFGCYKGNTSVLIGKLLQTHSHTPCGKPVEKRLWIYDSFAGLPEKTVEDISGAGANFQAGELFVTKREVVAKIRKNALHNVIIKKAWFDELSSEDLPPEIAFAFCDGDLYSSIKTSLKLVVPRLTKQGTIIVHDYNNSKLPGSARAVDEFLRSHPNFSLKIRHTLAILQLK